jgi:uncharacterized protein YuzB (UPF0349 family)
MKIRLCEHNQGSRSLVQQLQGQYPDLNIKLKNCAKQCKTCRRQPFALVDKQLIKADDPAALVHILDGLIKH